MIEYRTYQPHEALTDFVRFFWSLEAQVDSIDPFVHRALPDNCAELIFYCKGKLSISSLEGEEGNTFTSGVFGQAQKFRQFRTNSNFTLFGVYLYPYAFKLLFNLPAHHVCNAMIDSETLFGIEGKVLEEQIMLADGNDKRVQLISKMFLDRIEQVRTDDNAFVRHLKSTIDNNSLHSISSFVHECNLSRRQVERKFQDFSGFSPKDFFNIIRFKNVLSHIDQTDTSLAQIAIDTGYYDQSHFTNDFRKFSGYTPREFVKNYPEAVDMRATRDFKL